MFLFSRNGEYGNTVPVSGSEFDASHFVPDTPAAFTNDGFLADNGKHVIENFKEIF